MSGRSRFMSAGVSAICQDGFEYPLFPQPDGSVAVELGAIQLLGPPPPPNGTTSSDSSKVVPLGGCPLAAKVLQFAIGSWPAELLASMSRTMSVQVSLYVIS